MSLTDIHNVCSVAINSKGDIFVATFGEGILLSTNNGHTWVSVNKGLPTLSVSELVINSHEHVFAVVDEAGLFRSLDNGHSWSKMFHLDLSSSNRITSIAMNAKGELFIGASFDHHPRGLFKSTDGGRNWALIRKKGYVTSIAISSRGDIFLAENDNEHSKAETHIIVSRNNGDSWKETAQVSNFLIDSFDFDSKGHIFARCNLDLQGAYYSIDNGTSWTRVDDRFPFSEGGHLDTDFNTTFFSEWWYLNGRVDLVCPDGDCISLGFFFTISHEESSNFNFLHERLSWIIHFHAIYLQDGSNEIKLRPICVSQRMLKKFIALHTPYVFARHPDGTSMLTGSAKMGYALHLVTQDYQIDWLFHPRVENTLDHSSCPIDFYSFERSFGSISGHVILNGKTYSVVSGQGYFDHMMIFKDDADASWTTCFHGWSWVEVTTRNYQVVIYAMRSLADEYESYSYKKITLLEKHSGKTIAEHEGMNVTIMESRWMSESKYHRKRPQRVTYLADDLRVTIGAENVAVFDHSDPKNSSGFVDFMSHKPTGATIAYKSKNQEGVGFYEYLVTDMGAKMENPSLDLMQT